MNADQNHTISQVGDNTTPEPISKSSPAATPVGYNMRCPAVKRLLREAAELNNNPESDYMAYPTETNLFDWHFTVRGPESSEFENGLYHGRIVFPSEYPMKPPSFILLTPNGRFQTEEKICLSISNYHPETWLPSWSIRTALVALRSFMTTPGNEGAIGSLNFPVEERKKLANKSRKWECRDCGPIIKLLPLQEETKEENAKPRKDSGTEEIPKPKAPKQEDAAPRPRKRKSVPSTDNQPGSSSSTALTADESPILQQNQQNEPIKNIIYDFGIACFVILILALCLRRLLAIFIRF